MKGIILAGGLGTRLNPLTVSLSKHLLPIYDKPMIFYPLSVLMLAGIRDIIIVTTSRDKPLFNKLLGSGDQYGVSIVYAIQREPLGLVDALASAGSLTGNESLCLVLGDNLFYGPNLTKFLKKASQSQRRATVFSRCVFNPERFGVLSLDKEGKPERFFEKPKSFVSNQAVTGLYFFPNDVLQIAETVNFSNRREKEIGSLITHYLSQRRLDVQPLGRGFSWFDAGTPGALLEASNFVETIERTQGYKIACLEEIALVNGWLTPNHIKKRASNTGNPDLRDYLFSLLRNFSVEK